MVHVTGPAKASVVDGPRAANKGVGLSYASAMLSARHVDPLMNEGEHKHVWSFKVWWPSEPWRDARAMQVALEAVLEPLQGTLLPPDLWSAEALATRVLVLANIVRVDVDRPEGFGVSVPA